MELLEVLLVVVFVGVNIFPVAYAFARCLENKLLFIMASYGAETFAGTLLVIATFPIIILNTYMFPQLEDAGYLVHLNWLLKLIDAAGEYWYVLISSTLLVFPPLIHKRYREYFETQKNT